MRNLLLTLLNLYKPYAIIIKGIWHIGMTTMNLVQELKKNYVYTDYYIPYEKYDNILRLLRTEPLTQELVDYLCSQIDNPKSKRSCELRFIHLQPLFLNPSTLNFDLKEYLYSHITKCKRLWLKLFFIRAYAIYADESELILIMQEFSNNLRNTHDYIDYEPILSKGGLPFLCDKYGYECFNHALAIAAEEYEKINPLLRGYFTMNESGDHIDILTPQQILENTNKFLNKTSN